MTLIILDAIKAVILGVVEGFTEFLPISSTGHLILVNQFVSFDAKFTAMFDIVIQLGAILAVVVYFWKKLWPPTDIWLKAIVGVLPAIVFGALFASKIEEKFFNPWTVAIALLLGGIIILIVEKFKKNPKINSIKDLSFKTAFFIGLVQCLSLIPGTSRSGATIIGAMIFGASRFVAAEFSFFLAIPTMVAATAWSLLKYREAMSAEQFFVLAVGFAVSFIAALAVVKFFMDYVKKNNFKVFGWYRIALGALIVCWLAVGIFAALNKPAGPASVYVSAENAKQGDTIFIKVFSNAEKVVGNFGQEQLVFYKKANTNTQISFLGIDADQPAGDYKIFVDTSNAEHLTQNIKVALADFSTAPVAMAPSSQKTGITTAKAVENIRKNDNPSINKILGNFTAEPYFSSPFSFPLNTMEKSGFSFGKFIGFAKNKLQHFGVDLRAPENTDIYAVNDGKIVATLNLSNYGKTVIIDHGLDIFSMYLHLDQFKVAEGEMVKRGQLIGLSGDTGYATAPHLHFSMRVGGSRVDPVAFINASQKLNGDSFTANISQAFFNFFK